MHVQQVAYANNCFQSDMCEGILDVHMAAVGHKGTHRKDSSALYKYANTFKTLVTVIVF